jgi:hypothetical protein
MARSNLTNTKKNILAVQFISCIIINFLKIRDLYGKIKYSNLIDKVSIIKDISLFTYDILTLNLISLLCNTYPLYLKLRNIPSKIFNKIKRSNSPKLNI